MHLEAVYERILSLAVWQPNTEAFPYQNDIKDLLDRLIRRCKDFVSEQLKADDEPKLMKIVKMMRWMEQTLAKKRKAPTLDTIGYSTFSLSEYSEESDSS